jgi:hypothetical protein
MLRRYSMHEHVTLALTELHAEIGGHVALSEDYMAVVRLTLRPECAAADYDRILQYLQENRTLFLSKLRPPVARKQ